MRRGLWEAVRLRMCLGGACNYVDQGTDRMDAGGRAGRGTVRTTHRRKLGHKCVINA